MSVCPSIKRVNCDKTKETSAKILIPYKSSIYLVFWQEEWLVGTTPSTWNFGPNWPRRFRNADFQSISARSASAVAPSETNPIMTNKKVHYVYSSEPKVNSVRCLQAPPKGAHKRKIAVSRQKVHSSRTKSATQFHYHHHLFAKNTYNTTCKKNK